MQTCAENDNGFKGGSDDVPIDERSEKVAALKAVIEQIEYGIETALSEQATKQDKNQDQASHRVGFPIGFYHEMWAKRPHDHAAATGVMLEAIRDDNKPILWVVERALAQDYGLPYGPGLLGHGIDPARCVLVRTQKQQQTLWVIEEALKSNCFSMVFSEVSDITLKESRRLSLSAAVSDGIMVMLMRSEYPPSSAAYSRWQITPRESVRQYFAANAPGLMRASAYLHKHRAGLPPITKAVERRGISDFTPISEQYDEQTTDHIHLAASLVG